MSHGIPEEEAAKTDRQRLHRADRQGAADGVRRRDEPADRAADGGLHWLTPPSPCPSCRRTRAAPGWEFTRPRRLLARGLEPRARDGTEVAAPRLLEPPEGAVELARRSTAPSDEGRARRRTARSCCRCASPLERHPELVEPHLGTRRPRRRTPSPRQRARLDRRRVRVRPARRARRRADPARPRSAARPASSLQPAHADRARGGRRGRGVGAVPVRRRRGRDRAQHRRRARRRPERAACATSARRTSTSARGSSAPSAPRSRATARWSGSRSASAPAAARCARRRCWPARAPTRKVTGAYAPHGRQHVDFDTTQEHAAPNTTSDLAFRGILADRSSAVWRGMIKVDPGAQQTDAFQECRNLLLSKRAHADAIPGLEILANDVRCTHAAAIAQIDREQLFYLRSRGLGEADAHAARHRGLPGRAGRALRGGPGPRRPSATALERRLAALLG